MKDFKTKISSVSFRLILMLAGMGLALVAYFAVIATVEHRQQAQLYRSRIVSRITIFDAYVQAQSNQLKAFATDYTYWDEMVKFVAGDGKDLVWATQNIDTGLKTFNVNAVWVYNTKGKLIYATQNIDDLGAKSPYAVAPFSPQQVKAILKSNGVYNFYAKTSSGIFEFGAATIHPTNDSARLTTPQGYFFTGKLLGKDYLGQGGKAVEGTAQLIDNPANVPTYKSQFNAKSGQTNFIEKLADNSKQTIGAIKVNYNATDLAQDRATQNNLTIFGIWLFSILATGLFFALNRWVIVPLINIRRSLSTSSDVPISKLTTKYDEFGDISKLITQFFAQAKLLMAQKSMVEEMVLKRTHELRQEHARLQASIDSLEVGFMITFGDGQVAMCNPAMAKLFGLEASSKTLDPDGTIAITLSQIDQDLTEYDLTAAVNKCFKSAQSFSASLVNYGSKVLSVSGAPVRLHQTEIIGCVILISEVATTPGQANLPIISHNPSADQGNTDQEHPA